MTRDRGCLRGTLGKAIVALVVVAVVVAGSLWWFKPWEMSGTVRFDHRATFIYWGSENNEPLEDLALRWSAPQIDNECAGKFYGTWELYYIEDDNTLTLQMTRTRFVGFRGSRTAQLEMYGFGYEYGELGPLVNAWFDKLYPREVFLNLTYFTVEKNKADDVTLRVHGQIHSIAGWNSPKFAQENKTIAFEFASGLYREGRLVEWYEVFCENGLYGRYWMPRTA